MRRRTKALLLITPLILLFPALALARNAGFRLNMTASLPMGIYKVTPIDKTSVIKADDLVVITDLDAIGVDRALCTYDAMLKKVAALEGDRIEYDGKSVYINGRRLPLSQIFEKDKFDKALPTQQYPYTVPENCVYLTSEHPYGYDSRYYGAVETKYIAGTARMVLRFPFQERDFREIENL